MMPLLTARVGMELLEGLKQPLSKATGLLSAYSLLELIDWTSRVDAVLFRSRSVVLKDTQMRLIRGLCSGRLLRKALAFVAKPPYPGPFVFFDEVQMLYALRLAACSCPMDLGSSQARSPREFARALVILNDAIGGRKTQEPQSDENWIVECILPEFFFNDELYPMWSTARWEVMLNRLASSPSNPHFVDIASEYERAFGVTVAAHRALVFGLWATTMQSGSSRDVRTQSLSLSWNRWCRNYSLTEPEKADVERLARTPTELRAAVKHSGGLSAEPHDALIFRQRPLIRSDDLMWCVSLRFLIDKMSAGVYHDLFTHYRLSRQDRERHALSTFLGTLFEEYVWQLLRHCGQPGLQRLDNPEANRDKRVCDFAIVQGDDILLIETKSHIFTQRTTVKASLAAFSEELGRTVSDGAAQVRVTLERLHNGSLALPGSAPAERLRFIPVVVTYHRIPEYPLIRDWVDRAVEASGLTHADGSVAELQLLDITTLELLAPHLTHGLSLVELMRGRMAHESRTHERLTLWDYAWHTLDTNKRNEYLDQVFAQLEREIRGFWMTREKS